MVILWWRAEPTFQNLLSGVRLKFLITETQEGITASCNP